jgi:cellobiose phosphorylase
VFPKAWKGFFASRQFRGVTYRIIVERAGKGNSVALMVDGHPVAGNVVPLAEPGKTQVLVKAIVS